jgi:hypothetical protein|tara:strand:- start:85 stop:249 length:165 start_codon:yes stop_codon:yes gene_type:complete
MRDREMGLDEFGGKHMYLSVITWLRSQYPELLQQWEHKVRDAVEWADTTKLEDK